MRSILLGALLLLPMGALAHEGSLDSDGGHVDESTGAYHCHEGPCFSNQAKKGTRPEAKPVKARRPVTKGTPAPEEKEPVETEL